MDYDSNEIEYRGVNLFMQCIFQKGSMVERSCQCNFHVNFQIVTSYDGRASQCFIVDVIGEKGMYIEVTELVHVWMFGLCRHELVAPYLLLLFY